LCEKKIRRFADNNPILSEEEKKEVIRFVASRYGMYRNRNFYLDFKTDLTDDRWGYQSLDIAYVNLTPKAAKFIGNLELIETTFHEINHVEQLGDSYRCCQRGRSVLKVSDEDYTRELEQAFGNQPEIRLGHPDCNTLTVFGTNFSGYITHNNSLSFGAYESQPVEKTSRYAGKFAKEGFRQALIDLFSRKKYFIPPENNMSLSSTSTRPAPCRPSSIPGFSTHIKL
jgi:hypothetical protein